MSNVTINMQIFYLKEVFFMKKVLSVLLTAALLLCAIPFAVSAADPVAYISTSEPGNDANDGSKEGLYAFIFQQFSHASFTSSLFAPAM